MPKDAKALRRLEGSKLLRLNRGLSRLRFTATHLKHHHPTFSLLLLASECVLKLSALWRMRATLGLACAHAATLCTQVVGQIEWSVHQVVNRGFTAPIMRSFGTSHATPVPHS